MGERGEVDSSVIYTQHGQKTYFINVKENRYRDLFIVIAESLKNEGEGFERYALNIFEEDVQSFLAELERGLELLTKESEKDFRNKELPPSWTLTSLSGKKERYYRFSIHKRARMLQLVIAERKVVEEENGFARTIRIDQESMPSVVQQYRRMSNNLLKQKESRDSEPLRDPKLLEKYLHKYKNPTGEQSSPTRRVVVKIHKS